MSASPVIYALDFPSLDDAREGARRVAPAVGMIKVGLELFVESGPAAVRLGDDVGRPVFLDLKLHDIPETVERAVARAASLGAGMLTLHAGGGRAMLERAVSRVEKERSAMKLLAVTVLTSLDDGDLSAMGVAGDTASHALRLARLAYDAGVRGFVCSPREVSELRRALGPDVTLVTPGVRPATAPASKSSGDDQKRIATPAAAIAAGASWLVVGRPIRDADDPVAMARAITDEAVVARGASK